VAKPSHPKSEEGSSLRSLDVQGLVDELRSRKGGRFKPGDRVRHPAFGTGIVTKSSGTGDDEQISAVFPGQGEKKLIVGYVQLEKL
jgi:DNA helicase-2/ATP-dependent DNA helicase PcrA